VTALTEPRPLRRDAQANRDRIVAAARQTFAERGIDAPVEEIARRAGVGMGTIYRRFPAKEDLVAAVFEETIAEFVAAARDALVAPDAWDGFRSFLERAFVLHVENRAIKDVALTSRSGLARADALRDRLRPLIARLVERAQAEGSLRPDFQPADVSVLFWSMGAVIDATASTAPDFWRRQLGFVLDGLRANAASAALHPALTRTQLTRASARRRRRP
jgi:AcrR family transcriptional regulator